MTLLETLIAMSLLSILLITIFGLFRELASLQDLDKGDKKQTFYDNYSRLRFYEVFSHLLSETDNTKDFYFYSDRNESVSSSPSLVFIYNNGVKADPYNSSNVIGRLYVDNEKHELRLATWPYNLKDPHPHMYQEVLLPNVESMHFGFLSVAKDFARKGTAADIERRGEWQDFWSDAYKEMPVILQLHLKMKDDPNEKLYTFALPVRKYAIKLNR